MKIGGQFERNRSVFLAILVATLAIGIATAYGGWRFCRQPRMCGRACRVNCPSTTISQTALLAPGTRDTIVVPDTLAKSLHLRTAVVVSPAIENIRADGRIIVDPKTVSHVRAPVAGVVYKVGQTGGRSIQFNDHVSQGQLLAEISTKVAGKLPGNRTPMEIAHILAPTGGIVLEKNITAGDVVSPDLDLFKIVRWDRKGVLADVYEDDIAVLDRLKPEQRHWQVRLLPETNPSTFQGLFESFDYQFDPITGNGKVIGWIDDPKESIQIGQKVSVEVALPPATGLVAIPEDALFHVGDRHFVFVQHPSRPRQFTLRQVEPVRKTKGTYLVRSRLNNEQQSAGAKPLLVNERVLDSGCLELLEVLEGLQKR